MSRPGDDHYIPDPRAAPGNLPQAEGLARRIGYVPAAQAQKPLRKQQIFGDLISYQNDGKCSTAIVGKVETA
jgi:hypothetical protein